MRKGVVFYNECSGKTFLISWPFCRDVTENHIKVQVRRVLVRGNSKTQGPDAGTQVACSRKSRGMLSLRPGRLEKKQIWGEENQKFSSRCHNRNYDGLLITETQTKRMKFFSLIKENLKVRRLGLYGLTKSSESKVLSSLLSLTCGFYPQIHLMV